MNQFKIFLCLCFIAKSLYAADAEKMPAPYQTKSVRNYSKVIGWPADKTPVAPKGFKVEVFAKGLISPRNIYVAPNGDVFVSEANTEVKGVMKIAARLMGAYKAQRLDVSANRITLIRGQNQTTYLADLNQPYGILIVNDSFYVANTDGLWKYPYHADDTAMKSKGQKILDLPAGGYNNHWTRNLMANADKTKIFVAVGSGSNVAEHGMDNEIRRANILEIDPDGKNETVFASGLRNPNGLALQPSTGKVFTSVNERDELGDDLVPDYFTSVQRGGFYGWPYSYFGQNKDPRMKKDPHLDLVAKAIVPDVALGAHVAALGTVFYDGKMFPEKYKNGAFVTEHGSWNRSKLSGYKVVFIPFQNGKAEQPEDFLSGFVANAERQEVYGRPVGIAVWKDGSLLLADDSSNTVWRISYQ